MDYKGLTIKVKVPLVECKYVTFGIKKNEIIFENEVFELFTPNIYLSHSHSDDH